MKFYYQFYFHHWKLAFASVLMTVVLLIGCGQKTGTPEGPHAHPRVLKSYISLTGTIVEIDDHGNAVTDLEIDPFTERGWKLGDTLEATFATGQKIQIKFVENYSDVPVGDYLGRFSTSTKQFKLAINMGNISETLKLKTKNKVVLQKVESLSTN